MRPATPRARSKKRNKRIMTGGAIRKLAVHLLLSAAVLLTAAQPIKIRPGGGGKKRQPHNPIKWRMVHITATGRLLCYGKAIKHSRVTLYTDDMFGAQGHAVTDWRGRFTIVSERLHQPSVGVRVTANYRHSSYRGRFDVDPGWLISADTASGYRNTKGGRVKSFGRIDFRSKLCRWYLKFYDAVLDFYVRVKRPIPFNLRITAGSRQMVPFSKQAPYARHRAIKIPKGASPSLDTAKHELAHTVRHHYDGGLKHFLHDAQFYNYLRHHNCWLMTNHGFAFNEGWAIWWENSDCIEEMNPDGNKMVEGNVAAALKQMQAHCCASDKEMWDVLQRSKGRNRVHSFNQFKARHEKLYGCPCRGLIEAECHCGEYDGKSCRGSLNDRRAYVCKVDDCQIENRRCPLGYICDAYQFPKFEPPANTFAKGCVREVCGDLAEGECRCGQVGGLYQTECVDSNDEKKYVCKTGFNKVQVNECPYYNTYCDHSEEDWPITSTALGCKTKPSCPDLSIGMCRCGGFDTTTLSCVSSTNDREYVCRTTENTFSFNLCQSEEYCDPAIGDFHPSSADGCRAPVACPDVDEGWCRCGYRYDADRDVCYETDHDEHNVCNRDYKITSYRCLQNEVCRSEWGSGCYPEPGWCKCMDGFPDQIQCTTTGVDYSTYMHDCNSWWDVSEGSICTAAEPWAWVEGDGWTAYCSEPIWATDPPIGSTPGG